MAQGLRICWHSPIVFLTLSFQWLLIFQHMAEIVPHRSIEYPFSAIHLLSGNWHHASINPFIYVAVEAGSGMYF